MAASSRSRPSQTFSLLYPLPSNRNGCRGLPPELCLRIVDRLGLCDRKTLAATCHSMWKYMELYDPLFREVDYTARVMRMPMSFVELRLRSRKDPSEALKEINERFKTKGSCSYCARDDAPTDRAVPRLCEECHRRFIGKLKDYLREFNLPDDEDTWCFFDNLKRFSGPNGTGVYVCRTSVARHVRALGEQDIERALKRRRRAAFKTALSACGCSTVGDEDLLEKFVDKLGSTACGLCIAVRRRIVSRIQEVMRRRAKWRFRTLPAAELSDPAGDAYDMQYPTLDSLLDIREKEAAMMLPVSRPVYPWGRASLERSESDFVRRGASYRQLERFFKSYKDQEAMERIREEATRRQAEGRTRDRKDREDHGVDHAGPLREQTRSYGRSHVHGRDQHGRIRDSHRDNSRCREDRHVDHERHHRDQASSDSRSHAHSRDYRRTRDPRDDERRLRYDARN